MDTKERYKVDLIRSLLIQYFNSVSAFLKTDIKDIKVFLETWDSIDHDYVERILKAIEECEK